MSLLLEKKGVTVLRGVSTLFLEEKLNKNSFPLPYHNPCCDLVCVSLRVRLHVVCAYTRMYPCAAQQTRSRVGQSNICVPQMHRVYEEMRVRTSYVKLGVVVDGGLACQLSQALVGAVIHH